MGCHGKTDEKSLEKVTLLYNTQILRTCTEYVERAGARLDRARRVGAFGCVTTYRGVRSTNKH